MSYSSLSQFVQSFESGGNYAAVNPGGASGAYQFVPSTWAQYLAQIGGSTAQYPTAASAPAGVQDAVFGQAVAQNGLNDWTCSGCDAPLSNALAANPSIASLPVFAGGSPTNTAATAAANPGAASTPAAAAQNGCGSLANPLNWRCHIVASVAGRILYGIVGLLLIAAAIFVYAVRTRDQG